jgi:ABC-type bacteriocin/lantibiotic exporter with double-glycine peptidase domain
MEFKHIIGLLRSNRSAILYAFLLSVLLFLPAIMAPVFTQIFTDSILIGGIDEWLFPLLVVMGYVAFFSCGVTWVQQGCLLRLSNKIEISGAASYMWRIFTAPQSLFRRQNTFVLLSKSGAARIISETLTEDILSLFTAMVSVVLYFTMMVRLDLFMALMVLALVALDLGIGRLQSFVFEKMTRREYEELPIHDLILWDEQLSSTEIQNIDVFKATASEPHVFKQMMSSKIRIINAGSKEGEEETFAPFGDLSLVFFLNILLLISALRIMNRELTIGFYLAFQAYAAAFFYPMSRVLSSPGLLISIEKKLAGLYQDLNIGTVQIVKNTPEGISAKENQNLSVSHGNVKLKGFIEFKDVSFRYDKNGPWALEHFSLSLKPGQRAAMVGKSGAGKTTILKLLQGLYAQDEGEILIDGMRPRDISRDIYINSIGCANQKISFFISSIRDNITLWDNGVSDQAIYRAANDVCLHDFIASLDGAYDHMLEENGRNLSGGQQQRVEIARALLYNPAIVLLDEVTSALGPAIGAKIETNLVRRGCTCLQATHILANIIQYDKIIMLEQGRILAQGTHKELYDNLPEYADLYAGGWV